MPTIGKGPKSLMTEDPYHTPGYMGYCAQYKFAHGETFGKTTHRLLVDENTPSSGKSVLTDLKLPPLSRSVSLVANVDKVEVKRKNRDGNLKYSDDMIPGYKGFVPCHKPHVGARFTVTSSQAVADFEEENDRLLAKRRELNQYSERPLAFSADNGRFQRPLLASGEPKPYVSRHQFQHALSPYHMRNDNPDKKFLSGYAGFVPKYKGKLGAGYPKLTHEALTEFTNYLENKAAVRRGPVDLTRVDGQQRSKFTIYPVESGLIPHYTGHIPGEKFRNGACFAVTTTNARQLPATI